MCQGEAVSHSPVSRSVLGSTNPSEGFSHIRIVVGVASRRHTNRVPEDLKEKQSPTGCHDQCQGERVMDRRSMRANLSQPVGKRA